MSIWRILPLLSHLSCLLFFLPFYLPPSSFYLVELSVCVYMYSDDGVGVKGQLVRRWLSPSTMWVLGPSSRLRFSGLATALYHWAILPDHLSSFYSLSSLISFFYPLSPFYVSFCILLSLLPLCPSSSSLPSFHLSFLPPFLLPSSHVFFFFLNLAATRL